MRGLVLLFPKVLRNLSRIWGEEEEGEQELTPLPVPFLNHHKATTPATTACPEYQGVLFGTVLFTSIGEAFWFCFR